MRIEDIDPNLKTETANGLDVAFLDVRRDPFRVYGLYNYKTEPVFRRLPAEVADATNDGVKYLSKNTAGGRVRFSTDSSYIAIRATWDSACLMSHMPLSGIDGFDLYESIGGKDTYVGTFMPGAIQDIQKGYTAVVHLGKRETRSYTIHFPLYNCVNTLEVGIERDAVIDSGADYLPIPPVVYYGSSITQGGCASRPGNAYQNIISEHNNVDHINLGFSGSARGEQVMADYIASLDMSVFVMDYDHNAPTVEHLEATHENLFKTVRAKHPDLPVIFVTKPDTRNEPENIRRRNVVYKTFMNALDSGDKNVAFIDGYSLFDADYRDAGTVDGCHPNDYGFVRMAKVIGYQVELFLKRIW